MNSNFLKGFLFFVMLAVVSLSGCTSLASLESHSSDDQLISMFRDHKAEFDRLVRMLQEDSLAFSKGGKHRVSYFFYHSSSPNKINFGRMEREAVTKERFETYEKLIGQLNPRKLEVYFDAEGQVTSVVLENTSIYSSASVSLFSDEIKTLATVKGFRYDVTNKLKLTDSELPVRHQLPSTDAADKKFAMEALARPLENNWYIYFASVKDYPDGVCRY